MRDKVKGEKADGESGIYHTFLKIMKRSTKGVRLKEILIVSLHMEDIGDMRVNCAISKVKVRA